VNGTIVELNMLLILKNPGKYCTFDNWVRLVDTELRTIVDITFKNVNRTFGLDIVLYKSKLDEF